MSAQHAVLSPSHSERWINCPGSMLLIKECPVPEQSEYAAEGTAAHELAALCLANQSNADEFIGEIFEAGDRKFKVTENMAENVQLYLDTVRWDMKEEGIPFDSLIIEQKVSLKDIIGDVWGTVDAGFFSPFGVLRMYDLKYGQGTYVEVENNSQLLIYALAAWYENGQPESGVETIIVQPRFMEEGVAKVRRRSYTVDELNTFRVKLVVAIEQIKKKDKTLHIGPGCKFCPAMSICPEKTKQVFSVIPAGKKLPDPASLHLDKIIKVLDLADVITDWISAVRAHAESLAKSGVAIPGHKLVMRKGHRRWIDEIAVETAFGGEYGEGLYEKKLKSPAKLEKIIGKEDLKEYVETPELGAHLVPESAKGEAIQADASAAFTKLEE